MEALVSGQAGLAVVLSEPPQIRPVGAAPYNASDSQIEVALADFQDVERVSLADGDLDRLDKQVASSWAQDRALYRLYMLFDDPEGGKQFERRVVGEIAALAESHGIGDSLCAWLSKVELGPDHLARAEILAARYSVLGPYLQGLYPRLDLLRAAKREQFRARVFETFRQLGGQAAEAGSRPGASSRPSEHRSARQPVRPDSAAQRRAAAILAPILDAAALRLTRARPGSGTVFLQSFRMQKALNRIVEQIVAELAAELRRAGIADEVQPYSRVEIKKLLSRWGRSRPGASTSRSSAASRRAG